MSTTFHKRKLNKSLCGTSIGSLIERQTGFEYDEFGSKKPGVFWRHKSPMRDETNPADLQNRVNGFYQNMRGSDVAYVTTDTKNPNTMLWSTSPTNRMKRGESIKKDVAHAPVVRKRSKIFRGYNKTIDPPSTYFASKHHTEAKQGRYIAHLRGVSSDKSQFDKSLF